MFPSIKRDTNLANLDPGCVLVDNLKCYKSFSCSINGGWLETNLVQLSGPSLATQRCHIETENKSLDSSSSFYTAGLSSLKEGESNQQSPINTGSSASHASVPQWHRLPVIELIALIADRSSRFKF